VPIAGYGLGSRFGSSQAPIDGAAPALSRMPVLLIIPEPECPHRRERFYSPPLLTSAHVPDQGIHNGPDDESHVYPTYIPHRAVSDHP